MAQPTFLTCPQDTGVPASFCVLSHTVPQTLLALESGLSFPLCLPPVFASPHGFLGTIEGESLSAFRPSRMKNGSQHNIQRGELELSDKEGIAVLIWG